MKRLLLYTLILSATTSSAWADMRSVTLSVPSMNCSMCPVTVRKALERVDGVEQADVDYETRSAVILYDDQKTSVDQLTKATSDAGYPAAEVKQE